MYDHVKYLLFICSFEQPLDHKEKKYIVFESQLLKLFGLCAVCQAPTTPVVKQVMGSMVYIEQLCKECKYQRTWDSQPRAACTPLGNLLLSSAILCAGASATKVFLVLRHLNCACISYSAFLQHQQYYLQPAIHKLWTTVQQDVVAQLKDLGKPLVVCGDGRADSPGHSAKFGCYSFLEATTNKVIEIELVQVRSHFLIIYIHHRLKYGGGGGGGARLYF